MSAMFGKKNIYIYKQKPSKTKKNNNLWVEVCLPGVPTGDPKDPNPLGQGPRIGPLLKD